METKAAHSLESMLRIIREGEDAASVRAAVIDLGYEKNPDVYPVLIEQLSDPNPSIQHAAVISLGRYGNTQAIEELVKPKIIRSPVAHIRWAAVAAIGKLGDHRVIDYLLKAVEDPEWIVRNQAITELKGKVEEIIARKDVRLTRVLIHMFSLDHEEIVDLAINGFQECGQDCLHLLCDGLNNASPTIRSNTAKALGKLKSRQATPYLLEMLEDGEWQVRASAAEALGAIADKVSLEALVQKVQDNVEKVQEQAAAAIVKFGKQATIPLLNALSREKDKFALRAFLRCLGKIGDPKAAPALINYLRSSYFIVRQSAVSALIRFGPGAARLLLTTLSFNRSDIEPLKKDACDREHPEPQIRAIKALGGLEDHRAVDVLKQLVDESLPDAQDAAMQALYQIGCASWGRCCALKVLAEVGDASLVPKVAQSLLDHSSNVRLEAVRALGRMGGSQAVKHLVRMASKDPKDFVRAAAVRNLRNIGVGHPDVLEAALRCLKDKSRDVRTQAARLLGNFHNKKSILPLLKAMSDPHWGVRESAENALLNFGHEAVDPLITALRSSSWTTRFRAARLLGEIGDPKAIPPIEALLVRKAERKDVREVAETSLLKLQSKIRTNK